MIEKMKVVHIVAAASEKKALQIPLIGAGLFREVDNAQLPQLIQQRCFFRGGRHNVDDLHFCLLYTSRCV